MLTVKITGLEQAIQNARSVAAELGDEKVLLPVLNAQAEPLCEDICRRLDQHDDPKTPEKLRDEWIIAPDTDARGRATVRVGPKAGKGSRGFIAWFLERGTSRQAARPCVRPAYDAFAPGYPGAVAAALREKTIQVVRRLARRAVRR